MKKFVILGLVLSGAIACSSANNEEVQDVVAAEELAESEKSAEESEGAKEMRHDEMTLVENQTAELKADKEEQETVAEVQETAGKSQKVYPTASLVNLRQGPGMSHGIARVAAFGEAIELTGETHALWLKTSDGLWVSKLFVDENQAAQPIDPDTQEPAAMESIPTSEVSSDLSTAQVDASQEADLD